MGKKLSMALVALALVLVGPVWGGAGDAEPGIDTDLFAHAPATVHVLDSSASVWGHVHNMSSFTDKLTVYVNETETTVEYGTTYTQPYSSQTAWDVEYTVGLPSLSAGDTIDWEVEVIDGYDQTVYTDAAVSSVVSGRQ